MIFPHDFESKIGFDSIRFRLLSLCSTELGKEEVGKMFFSSSYDVVLHQLKSVSEMLEIVKEGLPFPSFPSHDVRSSLNEIKAVNSFMSSERLIHLLRFLNAFDEIDDFFRSHKEEETDQPHFPELEKEISGIFTFPELKNIISNAINRFGEVKDTASRKLYDIRQNIRQAQGSIQRAMKRVIDEGIAAGVLDKEVSPTIRDGRLVLPVQSSDKRNIAGIVHDESSTGKTVFIEPNRVVEASNRLRELEIEEKREISIILISIADAIRPEIDKILICTGIIGILDFINSKAKFAIELDGQLPHIKNSPEIEWYNARHPALEMSLKETNRKVVPLNIHLSEEKRILIISGPNAGGKSVCLKTVAAIQYMMQCGILPTLYYNSHMGIFKKLFIDIGDEQSFENDLSTYSSHLKNMRFFLLNADKNTLLLADEMGSGTEPLIGGAIAQAILSNLGKTGCYGVVTTHYQNLKTFADIEPGFVNGAMLYDRSKLKPVFQLSIGNPGSSFAIDIAHKMGIPNSVIDNAKTIVGEEYVNIEKYLSDITRDKRYWANKRNSIKEKERKLDNLLSKYEDIAGDLKTRRKEIISEARKEAREILEGTNKIIERTISEIRSSQAEKEKTKILRKNLKDYVEENILRENTDKDSLKIKELRHKRSKKLIEDKPAEIKKRKIVVGDFVLLDNSATPGEVKSISGKKAEVVFGSLRTKVDISRLKLTTAPKKNTFEIKSTLSNETYDNIRDRQLNFKSEIDIRGMRADEAIQAVTYFLDDAIQFGSSKIRILHGTGHGILKTLIRQQLKSNPAVSSYGDEDIRFGGAGITVVNLE